MKTRLIMERPMSRPVHVPLGTTADSEAGNHVQEGRSFSSNMDGALGSSGNP